MRRTNFTRRRVLNGVSFGGLLGSVAISRWTGWWREWFGQQESGVTVTIDDLDASVRAGEHVSVTSTVTNEGDSSAEATIDLVVGHDPERDGRIRTTLEPGESRTVTQGFDTYPVPRNDEFPVRVEVDDDSDERAVSVTGAEPLENAVPEGDLAVAPGTEVLFEAGAVDSDAFQETVWWVDGERVGDSMGPWPATYYAETGAHFRRETFDELGSTHVAAAVLPDEGSATYAAHWEVTVADDGTASPTIDDARPGEGPVTLAAGDEAEFELEVSDPAGGLDRVVWWLSQADTVLDVSELDGERDTATLTLDGDAVCHTCHVVPWVCCEDGRFAALSDTWELQDASLLDDEPEEDESEGGELAVSIRGTNAPVDAGEYLEVTAEVENVGESPITDELELLVGTDRDLSDTQEVSVEPGETGTAALGFETYPVRNDDRFPVRVEGSHDGDETEVLVYGQD